MARAINTARKCMVILERETKQTSYRRLARKYNMSKTSAHRFVKEKQKIMYPQHAKKNNRVGRPRKLNERDIRQLERALRDLRKRNVNFTAMDVVRNAGLKGDEVHRRTFTRYLNRLGYKFLVTRRKGLLTDNDKAKREKYARHMLKVVK